MKLAGSEFFRRGIRALLRLVPRSAWMFVARHGVVVSFSQFGEDVWILKRFQSLFSGASRVVEVGAFDGITYSNTALLEARFKTPTLLIEPSPRNARQARQLRPNAQVAELAIDHSYGLKRFAGHEAVSGLREKMSEAYLGSWQIGRLPSYMVVTGPLGVLLDDLDIQHVALLSIDVQGAELDVLRSLNRETQIDLICLELEGHHPEEDEKCRNWLLEKGFIFRRRLGVSEIWCHSNLIRVEQKGASVELPFFSPYASISARDNLRRHSE